MFKVYSFHYDISFASRKHYLGLKQAKIMEQDEFIVEEGPTPPNPQLQMIGKLVNYSLMILGAVGIVYFIATGKILGMS